jgi:gliding motility-associated-like protein
MKIANLIFLFLLLLTPVVIQAQKEGAVWPVGEGKQVNFQSGSFEFTDFTGNPNTKASICDKEGNLVLYTNGRTIWNSNHEIVLNGEKLIPDDAFQNKRPIFVPYPKKDGWYILFYEEEYYDNIPRGLYGNKLFYAEIDTKANNGKGEVVRQKIKIHDNYHSGPTIAGFCDNSFYWLVNDRNDNTVIDKGIDRIYFYKIDENGVNPVPVINEHFMIGNSGSYRFSPNGDKLSFFMDGSFIGNVIADFNFKTGELYNPKIIYDYFVFSREFSPDSRLLYYFFGPYLLQVDASITDNGTFYQSVDTIFTLRQNKDVSYPGQDIRLAPDGKLYIHYIDAITRKNKLGRINKPNLKGSACEPELNLRDIDFYNFKFPDFVTSFFRDKTPEMIDEVFPDAGPDVVMCSNSVVKIGRGEKENTFYSWSPSLYVNDPFLPQTIFSPQEFYGSPKKIEYILRATDGNCWLNFDATQITINPIPRKLPIEGSWSVCPFVEEVDYSTVTGNTDLQWLVDGGEIVSNPSVSSVKINWGATNLNASTSVISTNSFVCSDTAVFPVRINVQLITETPKGPAKICIAESTNVEYQIRNTNGSVYEWFPDAGEVVSGQGTNKVAVKWHGAGQHKISVEETSVSIDTICFGESVPLFVEIINDSLEIELQNVSYNLQNNLEISYISEKLQNHKHSLYLRKQNESGGASEITISDLYDGDFTVAPTSNTFNSEIISLKVTNSCAEIFLSNKLQTIVLKGFNDDFKNQIRLNWNINQFWGNDKLEHEIWHSTNGTDGWKIVEKVGLATEFIFQIKELSLTHFFRINEINRDKNIESWSNTIKIEVEDDLMIPDVFTPNGDGINDEWEIKNIYFHPFQEVVVYNRYGKKVYECKNDFIPWDGKINGEIFQGSYFYQIIFDAGNIRYGQVTILQ